LLVETVKRRSDVTNGFCAHWPIRSRCFRSMSRQRFRLVERYAIVTPCCGQLRADPGGFYIHITAAKYPNGAIGGPLRRG
jgi:hypothetical protein